MSEWSQMLVIGGGPAGMAAARAAAEWDVEVTLLDDQATPGGQIYRDIENSPDQRLLQTSVHCLQAV